MNYNTEVTLNPIYQNSDFEIVPINNDINLNLELTDFDIAVSIGGNPGEAATIEVGIVSTVDFATPASVTNSGTPYNAVFDFGIPRGRSCYLYVAYASDDIGTNFTMTFSQSLDYIAILESNTEILNPIVTDFAGLWKNVKGEQGEPSMPTIIITETPTGNVDGINSDFVLSNTPISQSAIIFLVNGIRRDITLFGNTCTLGFAPVVGSTINVTYFKYIDVLAITVADVINLGTAATKDTEYFIQREITPAFTASVNAIDVNCNNQVQYDTNSGTTDVSLSFSNLPIKSIENLLIIDNNRVGAFNLIIPSNDIVSGGITYRFRNLLESPLDIPIGASGELNLLFIFKTPTTCEIRISGGATQEDLYYNYDTITGGTMPTNGLVKLTIDSDKTGYIKLPDGTLLTTVAGIIDTTYTGVGGAITYYIPKNCLNISTQNSSLEGDVYITGLFALNLLNLDNNKITSLISYGLSELTVWDLSNNEINNPQCFGDILKRVYDENKIGIYFDFAGGSNALQSEVDTYLQATYAGLTYAQVFARLVTTNGGTIEIDTV